MVWFIFWVLLAHSTPADHPRISSDERNYIERSLDSENTRTKVCIIVETIGGEMVLAFLRVAQALPLHFKAGNNLYG